MANTFQIKNWHPRVKNTLRGEFDLRFTPPGMTVPGWTVHQDGASRWIALPSAPQLTPDKKALKLNSKGKPAYRPVVSEFDDETWKRLRTAVLAELEERYPEAFDGRRGA
jgi:hypothetical protein